MEQPDFAAEPSGFPIGSLRLSLSDEARASLDAVLAAQESARQRARQQTRRARLWFITVVGGLTLAVAFGPRAAHSWHGRPRAATPQASLPPSAAPAPLIPAAAAPGEERPAVEPKPAPKMPTAMAMATASTRSTEGCDPAAIRSAPWRVSPEACRRAFQADPSNASLALAVAQAEHARGHLPDSAQWANRALALDPKAAEAYVLVARAEAQAGREPQARLAYRRYLELAPRGWHRAEARSALRVSR